MDEKSIAPYKAQATKIEKSVSDLVIKTDEDLLVATDRLGEIKAYLKAITTKKEEATKPLNETLKTIRSWFAPLEAKAVALEKDIKQKMTVYQMAQTVKAEVKIAKVEAKVESGKMSLEKGAEKIDGLMPEKTVEGSKFALTFREDKKLKIVDEKLIPREYLIINEVLLRKDVLAGKKVPGAEIEIVKTPVSTKI